MATITDLTLPSGEWTDINTATSVPIGNEMTLYNKGSSWIRLYESETEPDTDSTDGSILTDPEGWYANSTVSEGSLTIWAKTADGRTGRISVEGDVAQFRYYYTFDGIDDYISIPEWTAEGDFEISCIVRTSVLSNNTILGSTVDSTDLLIRSDGRVRITNTTDTITATTNIVDGNDHTVLIKVVSGTLDILIDGVSEVSSSVSDGFSFDLIATESGVNFFNGVLYNISLTDYTNGDNRYYAINEGPSATEIIESISGQNGTPVNFNDENWSLEEE